MATPSTRGTRSGLPLPRDPGSELAEIEEVSSERMAMDYHEQSHSAGDPFRNGRPARGGVGVGMVFWFLFCLALLLAPILLPMIGVELPGSSSAILMGVGTVFLVLWAAVMVVTRLYVKPRAHEAFVITGAGTGRKAGEEPGARVVLDGGAIYIPVLHELIQVPLETMKVMIERRGKQSVITQDYLRAEITAEFYLRVKPDRGSIINAARSLGHRLNDYNALVQFVNSKVDSALRDIAANQTLDALNANRKQYAMEVHNIVAHDIEANGLNLESIAITRLDQTHPANLDAENNLFDAQGKRRIVEITRKALVEANQLEATAEQQIKDQDVQKAQRLYELEQTRVGSEEQLKAEVAKIQASKALEAQRAVIEKDRFILEAQADNERMAREAQQLARQKIIEAERATQLRELEKAKAVETADVERKRIVETAEVERRKVVEVASKDQEIAVQKKAAEKAAAEAARLEQEREREARIQEVETVKITQTAERERQRRVIEAAAAAETEFVRKQREADAEAYRLKARADGEKAAADAAYQARVKEAEAEAQKIQKIADAESTAATRRAQGAKAEAMVPVEVERARVDVEQQRVEVERKQLENKQQFSQAALSFELEKLRLELSTQAQVEMAKAYASGLGQALSGAQFQVFGDAETAGRVLDGFTRALGMAKMLDGFTEGLQGKGQEVVQRVVDSGLELIEAGTDRLRSKLKPEAEPAPTTPLPGREASRPVPPSSPSKPEADSKAAALQQMLKRTEGKERPGKE